jgi:hypothetical protein
MNARSGVQDSYDGISPLHSAREVPLIAHHSRRQGALETRVTSAAQPVSWPMARKTLVVAITVASTLQCR